MEDEEEITAMEEDLSTADSDDDFKNVRIYFFVPRSGELRMQKLKSHLVRTQSLNVLPL
ncbi:hypothetical protein [Thiolapillus sp.]|uniref:hypothetical protein n=1 Tax=Thiolapillus sp. TaxID=2017437 RepID=UPI003AF84B7B